MRLKEILVIGAAVALTSCGTPYQATDTDGTTVVVTAPDGVQTAFTTQYPTASNAVWSSYDATVVPIDWELAEWAALDQGDYLVRFDLDNENYYAWYDETGSWVGSAYVIKDYSTLPVPVSTAVANGYNGYTISSVNREFQKDRMVYEVVVKNSESKVKLLVDADGKIIKERKKPLD